MSLISIIGVLTPLMLLSVACGIISLLVVLVRTIRGRRKIPFFSIGMLVVPIAFFFAAITIINTSMERAVAEGRVTVLSPAVGKDSEEIVSALSNLYHHKGNSGSHPTEKKYLFNVCETDHCFEIVAAQDSRDPEMYWVSHIAALGISIQLGFTRISN